MHTSERWACGLYIPHPDCLYVPLPQHFIVCWKVAEWKPSVCLVNFLPNRKLPPRQEHSFGLSLGIEPLTCWPPVCFASKGFRSIRDAGLARGKCVLVQLLSNFPATSEEFLPQIELHFQTWVPSWKLSLWGTSLLEMSWNVVRHSSTLPADAITNILTRHVCQKLIEHKELSAGFNACLSRWSRAVYMEHPDLQWCYVLKAITMQLVESWLRGMLPFESWAQGRTLPHPAWL